MMSLKRVILAGACALAIGGAATAYAQAGKGGAGTATYWMTAETSSGMAAAASGGGNQAAMMAAMMGRGGQGAYIHNLILQLGSGRRAAGQPSAEHLPPTGLQAGPSLPLVSPAAAARTAPGAPWGSGADRPKGRMLIYWGCGERARAGQPVVVDFASLAAGKMPVGFNAAAFRAMTPPSPANAATYGEWPNQRSQTRVPAGGSLVGDHVVRGNYTPEIRFSLGQGQDFLAPVALTANAASASGSVPLAWRPVIGAKAWLASTMGAAENGDMVMWSSSESQAMASALDYAAPDELARLVQQKLLLPATAERCTIPAEVGKAAPQSMLTLVAFGGETNIAQPRPAAAAASWRPEWTVKLRTRSAHMGMLGMDMPDLSADSGDEDEGYAADEEQPKKSKKSKIKKGLGILLGN
jgi:hypothetical protein